jgi:hypothetical protein
MHLPFAVDSMGDVTLVSATIVAVFTAHVTSIGIIIRLMWRDNKARLDAQERRHSSELDRMTRSKGSGS